MSFPAINNIGSYKYGAEKFSGINLSNGTPLGEWERLENMCFSRYPALTVCEPAAVTELAEGITGWTWRKNSLVYTVADGIYTDGEKIPLTLSEGSKTLVNIGAYTVILPDFASVNTHDKSVKTFPKSSAEGDLLEYNQNQTRPTVSIYKLFYMDIPSTDGKVEGFSEGDNVTVEWTYNGRKKSKSLIIKTIAVESYTGKGCVSVNFDTSGLPDTTYFYTQDRRMERFMVPRITGAVMKKGPKELDFVIEHNNRLWGCSSEKHEVYCSKLGDPLNWGEYAGISTDAWAATVGTDGDFTGAAVYGDSVLFFKEDCVHIIYGTKASNFTVSTLRLRGVQKGSDKSLCISNGLLYYKAPEGIYAFNGSAAFKTDARLGDDITLSACGTADDRQVIMIMSDGKARCYDFVHDCWYMRTVGNAVSAHNVNGILYAIAEKDGRLSLIQLSGREKLLPHADNMPGFTAESGWIGRGDTFGYFKNLRFVISEQHTYQLTDVSFKIEIRCDGGAWQEIYSYSGTDKRSDEHELIISPIIPIRCQKLKIRLSGNLTVNDEAEIQPYIALHGIYLSCEGGSEIGGKH